MAVNTNREFYLQLLLKTAIILYLFSFAACNFDYEDIPGIDIPENLSFPETSINKRLSNNKKLHGNKLDYHQLKPDFKKFLTSDEKNHLGIFCYNGEIKSLKTFFKTAELLIDIQSEDYYYYEGSNATDIKQQYTDSSWFAFYPWKIKKFSLNLYKQSCVGIASGDSYSAIFRIRSIDFWRVIALACGLALFFGARHLAHNVFFHYCTGISVGIFGSLLIIVYIFSRYIPKKTGAVTVLIGGWGLVIYAFQFLWKNFIIIMKEYQTVVIGYFVVAGLISFAVIYRCGPVSDKKSMKLVQWGLQLLSLSTIFVCSQFREATLSIIFVVIFYNAIPEAWKCKARTMWRRRFPPKMKLLTEDEFVHQGSVETKNALEDLRQFCHSPDCNAWKTISRLKSPKRCCESHAYRRKLKSHLCPQNRFAEFVEGNSHLSDDEILSYEVSHFSPSSSYEENLLTSDDEDS